MMRVALPSRPQPAPEWFEVLRANTTFPKEDTCQSYEEEDTCHLDTPFRRRIHVSHMRRRIHVSHMRRRIHVSHMRRRIHVIWTHLAEGSLAELCLHTPKKAQKSVYSGILCFSTVNILCFFPLFFPLTFENLWPALFWPHGLGRMACTPRRSRGV